MQTEKQQLRKTLLSLREALPKHLVTQFSQNICQKILDFKPFQNAKNIGYYHALNHEVSLAFLSSKTHKAFYVPKITGQSMSFCQDLAPYHQNQFGILEPTNNQNITIDHLDMILVPMVGFDRQGHRLGMGKGYYDRLLSKHARSPLLVGVAYSFQERPLIPLENHDQSMDYIITEKTILKCR